MKLIEGLSNWTMNQPTVGSFFHIVFVLLFLAITIALVYFFKDASEDTMKRILAISWIILVLFELGKQLIRTYQNDKYDWGSFPFQFCETPLYVIPILLYTKNTRLKNALITYFATFVFFPGLALTTVPLTMFSENVFFNIRTMVQHGFQVALGIFLFSWNRKNINLKTFFDGSIIFLIGVVIAITLNIAVGRNVEGEMNMFFLSKDYASELAILKDIQPYIPWIVYVFLYVNWFYVLALACYFSETGIYQTVVKRRLQKQDEYKYNN